MWNINRSGNIIKLYYLYIKIKALVLCPFNSEKRKKIRKEFRTRLLEKKKIFNCDKQFDSTKIPIYIIPYNHLSYLRQMVRQLERYHLKNIHIIDNCSDYEPLLKYFEECPYTVHHMDKNYGHMVFWKSGKFDDVMNNSLYVVTDPDIAFNSELPKDFMDELYRILGEYPMVSKVGFAIGIDDIPDNNPLLKNMKNVERRYWTHRIKDSVEMYLADIDTTFALYRPGYIMKDFYSAIRVAGVFTSKHLPWYHVFDNVEEEKQYMRTSNNSSTMSRSMKAMNMDIDK